MSNAAKPLVYRVEQRKEESALKMTKNWHLFDECDTEEEAQASLAWCHAYDAYYHAGGWEYRIRPVPKKDDAPTHRVKDWTRVFPFLLPKGN